MGFSPNNSFGNNNFGGNNGNNNGNGEKKSFAIGRIYAADGQIDVGIYKSNSATWVSLSGKKAIGTNPANGSMAIEQTHPQQLPSVLLSSETARVFLEATSVSDTEIPSINFVINAGGAQHATLAVQGSPSDVKLTIKSDRGERTISLAAIPVGNKSIYASWKNLRDFVETGYKKSMTHKLNPEEFGTDNGSSEDDVPFNV